METIVNIKRRSKNNSNVNQELYGIFVRLPKDIYDNIKNDSIRNEISMASQIRLELAEFLKYKKGILVMNKKYKQGEQNDTY